MPTNIWYNKCVILVKGSDDMLCPRCNAEIPDNSCFCENCGMKIEKNADEKKCVNCGAYIEKNAKICGRCGFIYESINDKPMCCPVCNTIINPGDEFCGECGCNLVEKNNTSVKSSGTDKRKTILIVLIIVLSVLVLSVGAVIAGYSFFVSSSEKESEHTLVNSVENNTQAIGNQATTVPTVASSAQPAIPSSVNTYSYNNSDYLFPSDTVYISENDLKNRSKDEVAMIRNEIYARHGYIFETEPFKSYFNSKDWYIPVVYSADFNYSEFNDVERANINAIREYETSMGW